MITLDIELSAFYPEPTSPLESWFNLICPVFALQIYLRHIPYVPGVPKTLFAHGVKAKSTTLCASGGFLSL